MPKWNTLSHAWVGMAGSENGFTRMRRVTRTPSVTYRPSSQPTDADSRPEPCAPTPNAPRRASTCSAAEHAADSAATTISSSTPETDTLASENPSATRLYSATEHPGDTARAYAHGIRTPRHTATPGATSSIVPTMRLRKNSAHIYNHPSLREEPSYAGHLLAHKNNHQADCIGDERTPHPKEGISAVPWR